jgi:hypothetical protein
MKIVQLRNKRCFLKIYVSSEKLRVLPYWAALAGPIKQKY